MLFPGSWHPDGSQNSYCQCKTAQPQTDVCRSNVTDIYFMTFYNFRHLLLHYFLLNNTLCDTNAVDVKVYDCEFLFFRATVK